MIILLSFDLVLSVYLENEDNMNDVFFFIYFFIDIIYRGGLFFVLELINLDDIER